MKYIYSIILSTIIIIISLVPRQEFPSVNVPFADKWVHWLMYGTLTLVVSYDIWRNNRQCTAIQLASAAIYSATLGGLLELAQAYLTTTRSGDWFDFVANSFGAIMGFGIAMIIRTKINNAKK